MLLFPLLALGSMISLQAAETDAKTDDRELLSQVVLEHVETLRKQTTDDDPHGMLDRQATAIERALVARDDRVIGMLPRDLRTRAHAARYDLIEYVNALDAKHGSEEKDLD